MSNNDSCLKRGLKSVIECYRSVIEWFKYWFIGIGINLLNCIDKALEIIWQHIGQSDFLLCVTHAMKCHQI